MSQLVDARAQTWFSAVIAELRASWTPGTPWEEVIALRARLQQTRDAAAELRHQTSPGRRNARCSCCGGDKRPIITVRALVLSLGRFGIESAETVGQMDKAWAKYRALHRLDMLGNPTESHNRGRPEGLGNAVLDSDSTTDPDPAEGPPGR